MIILGEIAAQLKEPFALDDIDFLPKGKVERDGKTLCMALPYADPRVYQDRLNTVAYGEWSTPAPVVVAVGNKLVCYVTVILCGVPHTDVGEADAGENQGTEAWAQGFKRACSQFGLGRYLYDLEKEWVPFNPQRKQIDLDKAGKSAIVRKMYQKAGIVTPVAATNGRKVVEADVVQSNGHSPLNIDTIYKKGIERGTWTKEDFYAVCSALLDKPLSKANARQLEVADLEILDAATEEKAAATSGK